MKTREFLLAMAVILLSGCAAAAPLAMYGGSIGGSAIGAFEYGSMMKKRLGGNSEGAQDGVIVHRDSEYAQGIARKALANLGIGINVAKCPAVGANVIGTTKDGVEVVVSITEKTPKLTEISISAKKNGIFTDQVILKMVSEEIKKLAGIKS